MKRAYLGYWFGVAAIAAALLGIVSPEISASELSFVRGQKLAHMLSVCLDKKDALAILDADEKDGFAAAQAIWNAADRCATLPVQGGVVGKVVRSAKVKRGDTTVTARVVEILAGGDVVGYFFTTATVDERNS
jgi:hypothetical protein